MLPLKALKLNQGLVGLYLQRKILDKLVSLAQAFQNESSYHLFSDACNRSHRNLSARR